MKRIILFSAVLMFTAMLYGAVDFFKSNRHGELKNIYKEKPAGRIGISRNQGNARVVKKVLPVKLLPDPVPVSKPDISFDGFSRGKLGGYVDEEPVMTLDSTDIQTVDDIKPDDEPKAMADSAVDH